MSLLRRQHTLTLASRLVAPVARSRVGEVASPRSVAAALVAAEVGLYSHHRLSHTAAPEHHQAVKASSMCLVVFGCLALSISLAI